MKIDLKWSMQFGPDATVHEVDVSLVRKARDSV
jgi:hypothetical protein